MCILANSEDPHEMLQNFRFYKGLHHLVRLKQSSGIYKHHNLENVTFDLLKYIIDNLILIVLTLMGKMLVRLC